MLASSASVAVGPNDVESRSDEIRLCIRPARVGGGLQLSARAYASNESFGFEGNEASARRTQPLYEVGKRTIMRSAICACRDVSFDGHIEEE